MKFLLDAQLPPGLTRWLSEQGYEAQHVEDLGLRQSEDQEIWMHALKLGLVIFTKDEDFVERAAHSQDAPRIVWLRVGNTTNAALIRWVSPRFHDIISLLNRGDTLIEVR